MKKILFALSIIVFSSIMVSAQKPIKWRTSAKMVNETEGVITMKAIIEPGWHLYGTNIPAGGPKATKFDFSGSVGIKLVGDVEPSIKPINVHDKVFDLSLNWWDKTTTFVQKFTKIKKEDAKIIGLIQYMGCNDQTCLPPSTQKINITVPAYKK